MRGINWGFCEKCVAVAGSVLFSIAASSARADDEHDRLPVVTIAARQHFFGLDNVNPRTGRVREDRVILSWTGVSDFAASFKGHVVLLDAYIARDGGARVNGALINKWPSITYVGSTPDELAALKPELVLIGHTHFDHTGDLPTVVRLNHGVPVIGTAEHCRDLRQEVRDAPVNCMAIFEANAALGTTRRLPSDLLSGDVRIIAVKHPHSSASPNPVLDPPFAWTPIPPCTTFEDFPPQRDEPLAWGAPSIGPPSGAISIMYHIAIGHFGIAWEDTAGYIAGTPVVEALRSLPKTDIRLGSLAVAGRSVMDLHDSLLRPKVFIPLHLDSCMYLAKKDFDEHLAATPPDNRPEVWFLTDPGSYLRPIVIDPEAEIWER